MRTALAFSLHSVAVTCLPLARFVRLLGACCQWLSGQLGLKVEGEVWSEITNGASVSLVLACLPFRDTPPFLWDPMCVNTAPPFSVLGG